MGYNQYTLRNGLRVIHQPSNSKVAYCGFAINAGTRDERSHEHGMAHFVEHLIFKGTKSRKAWSILNRMEYVGGDLNAYTNKEETVVYAAFLTGHFARAVDLLGDIVFHSVFPQKEIVKEVEVILDEIRSYDDNPSELIFDDYEDILFQGHPLGHNILGDPSLLKGFGREDLMAFSSRYYHPSNMVFFVWGDLSFKKVIYYVEKAVGDIPDIRHTCERTPPGVYMPCNPTVDKGTSQAHIMTGCRAYDAYDEKRTALYLLNNMLGGPGMNSRLNISMRERRGLVYNVESNLTSYTDTGVFSIYFGTDPDNIRHCLRLVDNEMKLLRDKKLSALKFAAAKRQLTGQIAVASDNNENNALGMGKTFLHYNKWESPEAVFKRIDELTAGLLLEVANEIFDPAQMSTLIYK